MKPGAAFFTSGVVLGLAAGLALGHLVVWSRTSGPLVPTTENLPPLEFSESLSNPTLRRWVQLDQPFAGTDPVPFAAPDDKPAEFVDDIQYFPASPQYAPVGGSGPPAHVTIHSDDKNQDVGTASLPAEPDSLPETHDAAPIDVNTRQGEELTRAIIVEELPHATPEEVQIWFDALRGLPAEDVKGILRMRKNVDGVPTTDMLFDTPRMMLPHQPEAVSPKPAVESCWLPVSRTLQRARAIHLHNLTNARSVGFKRVTILWSDGPVGLEGGALSSLQNNLPGSQISGTLLDMTAGKLTSTGRMLDLAIEGPGLLRLRCGDQTAYTRGGHLRIRDDGYLARFGDDPEWRLDPPVLIPPNADHIEILEDGRICTMSGDSNPKPTEVAVLELTMFLDPHSLQPLGNGIYAPSPNTGRARCGVPGQEGRGRIVQGSIEESNVDAEWELRAIAEIDQWLSLLPVQQEHSLSRISHVPASARSQQPDGQAVTQPD